MTVSQKGTALVAIPLVLQLVFVFAVIRSHEMQVDAEELASHTKQVIAQAREIQLAVVDAHGAICGFAVTRDPVFAQPFHKARADVPEQLNELASLVADNPEQVRRIETIRGDAVELFDWKGGIEQLVQKGKPDEAVERIRAGHGNDLLVKFRTTMQEFVAEEERLDRLRVAAVEQSRAESDTLFVAGGIAAIVCTSLLVYAFRRGISRRVAAVEDTARRLANGESTLPPPTGNDEIARLDRAFRAMAAALIHDMAERQRAEAEVRRLNEELEKRVQVRTAELEIANRDLAEKNAENEMFVYSVSHDLRSPLVNLQGFSKELEKACRGLSAVFAEESVPADARYRGQALLDGKIAKSVGFIQTAVIRLSTIIDALLRLSRAGRVDYRWEAVNVAEVVTRVVGAAQGTIGEKAAAIQIGDLPPAWGDRSAVEQLFGNLIVNALTYLDNTRSGVIEVGCLPTGSVGVPTGFRGYYVRDNGLGIAEGHRQKIFQAFQRAHPGIGSGEGLGLAIVARVVERHRGRVWVESTPGAGSTFYVTLPVPPTAG